MHVPLDTFRPPKTPTDPHPPPRHALNPPSPSHHDSQALGSAPTVAVDATDGCQLYLPAAALAETAITTAKSSGVNVVAVAAEGGEGGEEAREWALPEQFVSVFAGGRWATAPVAHGGG